MIAQRNGFFMFCLKITFGRASFAKTTPAMQVDATTPIMDWMHISRIAMGHSSEVDLDPYLKQQKVIHIEEENGL